MIKLCLEGDYCQECPAFTCVCEVVDLKSPDGTLFNRDSYIKCANREQCRLIHDFVLLNKKTEE